MKRFIVTHLRVRAWRLDAYFLGRLSPRLISRTVPGIAACRGVNEDWRTYGRAAALLRTRSRRLGNQHRRRINIII